MDLSEQRRAEILEAATAFYHIELLKSPRILVYLRERKLSEEIVVQARLGYAAGGLKEHLLNLGFTLKECQAAGIIREDGKDFFYRKIVIPYLSQGKAALLRARTDPEEPDKAYFPLPGYPVCLYGEDLLATATQVIITEGEFDCLVLRQWGLDAVAIPGASAFKPEWVKLFEHCRKIFLNLDMDEAGRRATSAIAPHFGERSLVIHLPQGKDVTEYACLGGTARDYEGLLAKAKSWIALEVERLPQLPDHVRAESAERLIALLPQLSSAARVVYQDQLCKALGWSKQTFNAVSREVQAKKASAEVKKADRVGALDILERESQINWLHPAQDFIDGILWYGVPTGEQLLFLTSGRRFLKFSELPEHLRAAGAGYSLRRISNEAVKRYLDGGLVAGHLLSEKLSRFLRRFVFFRDERMSVLVAVWMMGTYAHVLFRYYGYLLIHSPAKRCGKYLLEEILSKLAFNATPIFTHPTPAQLYRGPARDRGTQILDEVDRLRGNKELFGELLAVLNVGFQRGSMVLRYERVGDSFQERSYEAYAPRVLAGIATTTMPDVLEDRSILISMHRKRSVERVERFNVRRLESEIQGLRDELYLWALGHAEALAQLYDQMEEVPALSALDDRLRDVWEPLVAIGSLSDAERNDGASEIVDTLVAIGRELCQFRSAAEQETPAVNLIRALEEIRRSSGEYLTPTRLLDALRQQPGFDWLSSARKLSELLRPLGLITRSHRFPEQPDKPQRAYHLDPGLLRELESRYAAVPPSDAEESVYAAEPVADPGVTS